MKVGAMVKLYQLQNENKDYNNMDFDDRFNPLVSYYDTVLEFIWFDSLIYHNNFASLFSIFPYQFFQFV